MQIEEAKKILSDEITALNVGHEKYEKAVETLIYYIEMMHSELDRLEGIEDNTSMLKQKLIETKEHNRQLALELEKKDAVINMMTGWLYANDTGFGYGALKDINTPEKIQEYFYKKV